MQKMKENFAVCRNFPNFATEYKTTNLKNIVKKMLRRTCSAAFALGLLPLALTSCQDEMKDYYEEPNWLRGSIYEILEERGNYTQFLAAVERCDYTALLKGRSILTVMAPDDASMNAYLQSHYGTTSVADLSVGELKKLVGFHLLYYSFDKQKLVNFRPNEGDGATEEEKEINAGLYYKFRTRSQDPVSVAEPSRMMLDDGSLVDTMGVEVEVYHLERFLPVFSYAMFNTKVIDAKYNYEYFFPESEWTGDDGFNVSDASVTEYEVPAKNGYIYFVDRVVKPLETIHTELEANPQYSLFLSLYDRAAYYAADADLTALYGGGTHTYWQRLYQNTSFRVPNIDSEWPVSDYTAISALASTAYSIFAPTNDAFKEFYNSYWGDPDDPTGYPLLSEGYSVEMCYDSVSTDAIDYLLSNSVDPSSMVFPEEIKKGDVENLFTATPISFDVDSVPQENRKMCVNGVIYGQAMLTPPAVFGSVTGPAYKYKRYNMFLKMLGASDMKSTLTSDAVNFIMLYPNDAQFEANNVWYDAESDKLKSGPVGSTTAGNLGSADQANYVNSHIISLTGSTEKLPESGLKVYRTLNTNYRLYIYVKGGKISNSFAYNSLIHYAGNDQTTLDSVYTDIKELTFRDAAWSNGHCYEYDPVNRKFLLQGSNANSIYASFMPMIYSHRNDEGTLFQGFIQLLLLANMIDEQAQTMNYMTENCMMLVPTTDAIKTAILEGSLDGSKSKIPYITTTATSIDDPDFWSLCSAPEDGSVEQTYLQHYMLQYFLPESTAPATEYPYPGWGQDTAIPTIADVTKTPARSAYIDIGEDGNGLFAYAMANNEYLNSKGETIGEGSKIPFLDAYDGLPFVFDDGCVQFITGVFENNWPEQ